MTSLPHIARIAIALMALHVIDDSFLQPAPSTTFADHLISGLVPLAALTLAAWAYPRLRAGARAATALVLGPFGIALGAEAVHYWREVGLSGDDYTGLLAILAGTALLGVAPRRSGPRGAWTTAAGGATRGDCCSAPAGCWASSG